MIRKSLLAGSLLALSPSVFAQVPVEQLAKPPANATHSVVESTAGKHGDSWIWSAPDGIRIGGEGRVAARHAPAGETADQREHRLGGDRRVDLEVWVPTDWRPAIVRGLRPPRD